MIIHQLPGDFVTVSKGPGEQVVALRHTEQRELLEALARIHGFSLVDHVERRELVGKVEEVRGLRHKAYGGAADGWQETLGAAEALAEAVAGALDLEA